MKPESDQGVVDTRLNVYGMTGLKVADMSIVLKNVGMVGIVFAIINVWSNCLPQNTYSTALLIGEKAALIIAEDLGMYCRPHAMW
jgi:alcohol oxidase